MTALRPHELERLLKARDRGIRLYLFAGPEEARSEDLARRAVAALGDPDDRMSLVDIPQDALRQDPGRLADEACATSMFGGERVIRVLGAGESARQAVEILLEAAGTEHPVVMTAGNLAKSSKLRKLAEGAREARIVLSYAMTPRDARQYVLDEAQALGLRPERGVAEEIVETTNADVGLIRSELGKYACYLDSRPDHPQALTMEAVEAVGAGYQEEDISTLVDGITSGNLPSVEVELDHLSNGSAIPALRRMAHRALQLMDARRLMDQGMAPDAAVKGLRPPVFWKEAGLFAAALPAWPVGRCQAALRQMLAAERGIKAPGSPGDILGWQALLRVAIVRPSTS